MNKWTYFVGCAESVIIGGFLGFYLTAHLNENQENTYILITIIIIGTCVIAFFATLILGFSTFSSTDKIVVRKSLFGAKKKDVSDIDRITIKSYLVVKYYVIYFKGDDNEKWEIAQTAQNLETIKLFWDKEIEEEKKK